MESEPEIEDNESPTVTVSSPTTEVDAPKKKKRRRRREKTYNFGAIPGVHKIPLSELTQKIIGCVVGEHVTIEKPWINVDKELLQDNLELHDESSEFLPIREEILKYPRQQILLGYASDEVQETDEFYICLSEEATDTVTEITKKILQEQEQRLHNTVFKKVRKWHGFGSESEVIENTPKNNRRLIEVEIESKYPILPLKTKFKSVRCEDIRDGYIKLLCTGEDQIVNIYKKRISSYIQAAPSVRSNEAQTICTYPSNAATQYEYDISNITIDFEKYNKCVQKYIADHGEDLTYLLKANGSLNLYSNDYESLVKSITYKDPVKVSSPNEYMSFLDTGICKGKLVSSACWHPMWAGIVAISYVSVASVSYRTTKKTEDVVDEAMYDRQVVLIWSFDDDLKPKLILEAHREVNNVRFCPFNENILVGGCVNGQIIVWDIRNKLQDVEREIVLTNAQQKYKTQMNSMMGWMKNVYDISVLRPTVISDLKYSPQGSISMVRFLSPFYQVNKVGKTEELPESDPPQYSLQFITSSADGNLYIWDLNKKPSVSVGGFKPLRKLRRLTKIPSALTSDISPYKMLHLNLRPLYKIIVDHPFYSNKPLILSSFTINIKLMKYERDTTFINPVRNIFRPILDKPKQIPELEFFAGSLKGCFINGKWTGQDFDSGEIINYEKSDIINYGKYHDGAITSIALSSDFEHVLTVGGKIFALWNKNFKQRPVLWRKAKSNYTHGDWLQFKPSRAKLVRIDGYMEIWMIFSKSKQPSFEYPMSRGLITTVKPHTRKLQTDVYGFADQCGAFRLFYIVPTPPDRVLEESKMFNAYLKYERERKNAFIEWQTKWNEKYASTKKSDVSEKIEQPIQTSQKIKTTKTGGQTGGNLQEIKIVVKEKSVKLDSTQRYSDWLLEQHAIKEKERIKNIILSKKQLDTALLKEQKKPLEKLHDEKEEKMQKQKKIIKQSRQIFDKTIATLFPDLVKEKPIPPEDPYSIKYSSNLKSVCYETFHEISKEATSYVNHNPFVLDFNWYKILAAGKSRRKFLDITSTSMKHEERYKKYKSDRAAGIANDLYRCKIQKIPSCTESKRGVVKDSETFIINNE